MTEWTVTRCQQPVGQGGFHTTELGFGGRRYTAVYDCGALPRQRCLDQVAAYATSMDGEELDLLVLSHLDQDHTNAVEELIGGVGARSVVIPYLNDVDRLVELARCAARGTLTGSFIEMIADPQTWFVDRGAGEVIEVEAGQDGDELGAAEPLDSPEPPDTERAIRTVFNPADIHEEHGNPGRKILRSGRPLFAGSSVHSWLWMFLPYAIRGKASEQQAFVEACKAIFGVRPGEVDEKELARVVRGALSRVGSRRELARAYDHVTRSRNSTSLALYAGPPARRGVYDQYRCGWLGTGDWPLATARRRQQFQEFYKHLVDFVETFCVPHHGSRHNFPPLDFWQWLNPHHAVISAGGGCASAP
jgi:hypothetical protein